MILMRSNQVILNHQEDYLDDPQRKPHMHFLVFIKYSTTKYIFLCHLIIFLTYLKKTILKGISK